MMYTEAMTLKPEHHKTDTTHERSPCDPEDFSQPSTVQNTFMCAFTLWGLTRTETGPNLIKISLLSHSSCHEHRIEFFNKAVSCDPAPYRSGQSALHWPLHPASLCSMALSEGEELCNY